MNFDTFNYTHIINELLQKHAFIQKNNYQNEHFSSDGTTQVKKELYKPLFSLTRNYNYSNKVSDGNEM